VIGGGDIEKHREFLYVSAINTGNRIVTITNVGWEIGWLKKEHAIQVVQKDQLSSGLPVKIDDGEEAKWFVPLDLQENWIERFTRDFLHSNPNLNIRSLRIQIHTSVGKTFETSVEKNLKERLIQECKKQRESRKLA